MHILTVGSNLLTPDAVAVPRAHRELSVRSLCSPMGLSHSCLSCLMTWHPDSKRKPFRRISPMCKCVTWPSRNSVGGDHTMAWILGGCLSGRLSSTVHHMNRREDNSNIIHITWNKVSFEELL